MTEEIYQVLDFKEGGIKEGIPRGNFWTLKEARRSIVNLDLTEWEIWRISPAPRVLIADGHGCIRNEYIY